MPREITEVKVNQDMGVVPTYPLSVSVCVFVFVENLFCQLYLPQIFKLIYLFIVLRYLAFTNKNAMANYR